MSSGSAATSESEAASDSRSSLKSDSETSQEAEGGGEIESDGETSQEAEGGGEIESDGETSHDEAVGGGETESDGETPREAEGGGKTPREAKSESGSETESSSNHLSEAGGKRVRAPNMDDEREKFIANRESLEWQCSFVDPREKAEVTWLKTKDNIACWPLGCSLCEWAGGQSSLARCAFVGFVKNLKRHSRSNCHRESMFKYLSSSPDYRRHGREM